MYAGPRRTQRGAMSTVEPVTDGDECELLARVAARDREAMRQFYLLYYRRLTRFLARITRRGELVEEIVNDTMLIVWRRAAGFRGGSRVSTWVMGIAWRSGLNSLRRERRAASYPAVPEVPATLEADTFECLDALDQAMSMLSSEHRAVIDLAYVGGYSCEEIGTIMQSPVNTVKTRLFYARRRVRAALEADATQVATAGRVPPVAEPLNLAAGGRLLT